MENFILSTSNLRSNIPNFETIKNDVLLDKVLEIVKASNNRKTLGVSKGFKNKSNSVNTKPTKPINKILNSITVQNDSSRNESDVVESIDTLSERLTSTFKDSNSKIVRAIEKSSMDSKNISKQLGVINKSSKDRDKFNLIEKENKRLKLNEDSSESKKSKIENIKNNLKDKGTKIKNFNAKLLGGITLLLPLLPKLIVLGVSLFRSFKSSILPTLKEFKDNVEIVATDIIKNFMDSLKVSFKDLFSFLMPSTSPLKSATEVVEEKRILNQEIKIQRLKDNQNRPGRFSDPEARQKNLKVTNERIKREEKKLEELKTPTDKSIPIKIQQRFFKRKLNRFRDNIFNQKLNPDLTKDELDAKFREFAKAQPRPGERGFKVPDSFLKTQSFDRLSIPKANKIDAGLGSVSAIFESRGKPDTISSGIGDVGGKSFGVHQLASGVVLKNGKVKKVSNVNTLQNFLKQSKFKSQFDNLEVGSLKFDDKFRELSKNPDFVSEQSSFLTKRNFNPVKKVAKEVGFDTDNRAVQEALFSMSIQHGRASDVVRTASESIKDNSSISDQLEELFKARTKYVESLKINSIPAIINRFKREEKIIRDRFIIDGDKISNTKELKPEKDQSVNNVVVNNTPSIIEGGGESRSNPVFAHNVESSFREALKKNL